MEIYIFDNDVVFYEWERAYRYVCMMYQCGLAHRLVANEGNVWYYKSYLYKEI